MKKFNIDQMFGLYSAEEDKTHVFAKGTSSSGKVLYAFVLDEGVYQFTTEKQMTEIFNALRKSGWKVLKTVKVEKQEEDAPKSKGRKKAAAPKTPKAPKTEKEKMEKMAENAEKRDEAAGYEKPKTRSEALEKKYGSLEERRAFAIRRREVKDECYKALCEEVKKSGKRLPRKVFCDRLEKMVKERMA